MDFITYRYRKKKDKEIVTFPRFEGLYISKNVLETRTLVTFKYTKMIKNDVIKKLETLKRSVSNDLIANFDDLRMYGKIDLVKELKEMKKT